MAENSTRIVITAKDDTRAAIDSAIAGLSSIKTAAMGLPVIGTAIAAAFSGAAITAGIKSVIDGADQLQKASQKYGVAVEQLSALTYAGKLSDVSLEAIGQGLKKLSVNMLDTAAGAGEAQAAFKALGISVTEADGTLRSTDAVFADIADKFAGMEDGAGKTALAVKIFGKSGAELIPLLNQGSRGLADMKTEAEKLGVLVGGDLAAASERFNDNLTRLGEAARAGKIALANELLPTLNTFVEQLLAGVKAAGGFIEALKLFGTINPFKNHQENIRAYSDDLGKIEKRLQYAIPDAERRGLEANAEALRKRIAYLKEIAALEANANTGRGRLDAKDLGPAILAKAPNLPDAQKTVKGEDPFEAMKKAVMAQYELAEGAAKADAEIEKQRDHFVDMIEPAAKTMREFRKFEEIAPALDLSADQLERIRDVFREKIAAEEFGKPLKDITEEIKKQDNFARDLGLTFQSAFEDAVIGGKKFSDVLKGLAQDLARIALRKTVTEPFGNMIAQLFNQGGYSIQNIGSTGNFDVPQYAAGTPYVPENQFAFLHKGEAVIPAEYNRGGGVTVNIVNQTPARVTTRESMVDGRRQLHVMVQDAVGSWINGGGADGVMGANFGARRMGVQRG